MEHTNKKILMTLSVLATPFVFETLTENNIASANTQYNLTQSVKVYGTAESAAKQGNTSRTYATGTYYVYKEHNGMINISKTQGKPGSWINPTANKPVAVQTPAPQTQSVSVAPAVTTPVTTQASAPQTVVNTTTVPAVTQKPEAQVNTQASKTTTGNTYTLNNAVKVYSNAAAAKTQRGSRSTYASGNYFIFKEFNGMMNISKVAGRAGAWINPLENKVITAKATTPQKNAEIKPVETKPAVSVNTNSVAVSSTEPKKETVVSTDLAPKSGSTYILKSRTNIYSNAVDAGNSTNSTNSYDRGTYYVYKTYNGMINISRTRGRVGAWINPLAGTQDISKTSMPASTVVQNVSKVSSPVSTETTTKNNTRPEVKKVTKLPLGPIQIPLTLEKNTNVYATAADALAKRNPLDVYEQGTYYVYNNSKGALNLARNKMETGFWVNPNDLPLSKAKSMPIKSTKYSVTSPWLARRNITSIGVNDVHNGVDIVTSNSKEPILATNDGVVLSAGKTAYNAERVVIKHGEYEYTAYWHLAKNSITVKPGDVVKAGQQIGIMGTTGLSTGIHLHFSYGLTPDVFDTHQDPMEYLKNVK